jgi:hypothetical protein
VLLCGRTSGSHKRRYRKEAFEQVSRYNGRHNYLNHGKPGEARDYQSRIATVENARLNEDGLPVGDLAVNPEHPYAKAFLWDVENKPSSLGMSHRAGLKYKFAPDGWEDVHEINVVDSVDIVTDPGTTSGMFTEGKRTMTTLKSWLPEFLKRPDSTTADILKVKTVLEMEGMGDAETPEGGGVPEAIKSACAAIIDECMSGGKESMKGCLKKLRKVLGIHHSMGEDDEAEKEGEGEEKPEPKEKAEESKRPQPWDVLAECQREGYTPTATELKALSVIESAADRKAFVTEQRAKVPAATPRSSERRPGGATITQAAQTTTVAEQRAFPAWN